MFSLILVEQPLQVVLPMRRVSMSINDLPREPKQLHISVDFRTAAEAGVA